MKAKPKFDFKEWLAKKKEGKEGKDKDTKDKVKDKIKKKRKGGKK